MLLKTLIRWSFSLSKWSSSEILITLQCQGVEDPNLLHWGMMRICMDVAFGMGLLSEDLMAEWPIMLSWDEHIEERNTTVFFDFMVNLMSLDWLLRWLKNLSSSFFPWGHFALLTKLLTTKTQNFCQVTKSIHGEYLRVTKGNSNLTNPHFWR